MVFFKRQDNSTFMRLSGKGYTLQSAWMQKDFEKEGCEQSSDWSSHIPLRPAAEWDKTSPKANIQQGKGKILLGRAQMERTSFAFARSFAITKIFKGQGIVNRGPSEMLLQSMLNWPWSCIIFYFRFARVCYLRIIQLKETWGEVVQGQRWQAPLCHSRLFSIYYLHSNVFLLFMCALRLYQAKYWHFENGDKQEFLLN